MRLLDLSFCPWFALRTQFDSVILGMRLDRGPNFRYETFVQREWDYFGSGMDEFKLNGWQLYRLETSIAERPA